MQSTSRSVKRFARIVPLLLLAGALSGCAMPRGSGEDASVVGWKTVMQKVAPAYLIAVDRSQCTVTAERYEKAKEGDSFFCAWSRSAVAKGPQGGPLPGEEVGIPGDPNRPRVPPPPRDPPTD